MKWFDAKKTLPSGSTADRRVLMYCANTGHAFVGSFPTIRAVTHWAELPESPEQPPEWGDSAFRTWKTVAGWAVVIHRVDGPYLFGSAPGCNDGAVLVWDRKTGKTFGDNLSKYDLTRTAY